MTKCLSNILSLKAKKRPSNRNELLIKFNDQLQPPFTQETSQDVFGNNTSFVCLDVAF